MTPLRAIVARLGAALAGHRRDRDFDGELESHLALHIDDNVSGGMPPDEARRMALARLGGVNSVREAHREQRRFTVVDALVRDVRHGARLLRRHPLFAIVAVLSLGLGIGANAAVFTIANALMLRSLPVHEPERLALLSNDSWTYPILEELQRHRALVAGVAGWANDAVVVRVDGRGERDALQYVSGGFFEVLGANPRLGRTISIDDDRRGGGIDGPVAVISHAYWQRRFGGDAAILSRALTIDGVSFAVVGVMPEGFFGPEVGRAFDVAVPFGTEPLVRGGDSVLDRRSTWWLNVLFRLGPGQSIADAEQALRAVQPLVREATMPEHYRPQDRERYLSGLFTLEPASTGRSTLRTRYERPLGILAMAGVLVLLVTCANMANLLLARAHGMSTRLALGASRSRLIRQLLVEGLLLAGGGALAGLGLSWFSSRLIVGMISTADSPVHLEMGADWRVLAFTACVATVTALLFSVVPSMRATNVSPNDAIREQSRAVAGEGRLMATHALVVAQVALSLALLVVAGLLVRTFTTLSSQPLGLDPGRVLVADVSLGRDSVEPDARYAFYAQMRSAAAGLPGVDVAATSSFAPMSGAGWNTAVDTIDGRSLPGGDRERVAWLNAVSSDFFATYGTALRAGRAFAATDDLAAPPVAIVNDAFVLRYMNGEDPIGRLVKEGGPEGQARVVVGRVADARYFRDLRREPPPTLYVPQSQLPALGSSVVVSVRVRSGNPLELERALASALENAGQPVTVRVRPLEQSVRGALVQERLVATVGGFFGALALLIAGVGLYGVTAYSVSRRRAELGIRLTLGATPAGIVSLVFTRVAPCWSDSVWWWARRWPCGWRRSCGRCCTISSRPTPAPSRAPLRCWS